VTSLSEFLDKLAMFDIASYIGIVDRQGRGQLRNRLSIVEQVDELATHTTAIRRRVSSTDRILRNMLVVADLFLQAQRYILTHDQPRYEPYASLRLLRHVTGVDSHQPLAVTQRRIWQVFGQLLDAHLDFEAASLSGGREPREQFDPQVSRVRYAGLGQLRDFVPTRFALAPTTTPTRPGADLPGIGADLTGTSVVRRLLVLPQTRCHDEVAFLYLILLSECLFWGALLFVQRALTAFHLDQLRQATSLVQTATEFATPLIKIFHTVRSMPPSHFLSFRDATGEASAVQSQGWQLLDTHMYGVLPEKAPVLAGIPEVRHVLRYANPTFVPLVHSITRLDGSAEAIALRDAIVALDQRLRAWRSFHTRQLAGRRDPSYLPPEAFGTGGTSGYGYLAAHRPARAAGLWTAGAAGAAGAAIVTRSSAGSSTAPLACAAVR